MHDEFSTHHHLTLPLHLPTSIWDKTDTWLQRQGRVVILIGGIVDEAADVGDDWIGKKASLSLQSCQCLVKGALLKLAE